MVGNQISWKLHTHKHIHCTCMIIVYEYRFVIIEICFYLKEMTTSFNKIDLSTGEKVYLLVKYKNEDSDEFHLSVSDGSKVWNGKCEFWPFLIWKIKCKGSYIALMKYIFHKVDWIKNDKLPKPLYKLILSFHGYCMWFGYSVQWLANFLFLVDEDDIDNMRKTLKMDYESLLTKTKDALTCERSSGWSFEYKLNSQKTEFQWNYAPDEELTVSLIIE